MWPNSTIRTATGVPRRFGTPSPWCHLATTILDMNCTHSPSSQQQLDENRAEQRNFINLFLALFGGKFVSVDLTCQGGCADLISMKFDINSPDRWNSVKLTSKVDWSVLFSVIRLHFWNSKFVEWNNRPRLCKFNINSVNHGIVV
jgi:hypothetical protein